MVSLRLWKDRNALLRWYGWTDNTNRNPEVRSHYIALAQKYAVKIRAFFWHDGIALAWSALTDCRPVSGADFGW